MESNPVTQVLHEIGAGDSKAADRLLPLVYAELRRLAESRLRAAAPGNTLQPTALVHEAYLRLVGEGDPGWDGRHHFFGAAAQAMRDILVEQARRKGRQKRGAGRGKVTLDAERLPAVAEEERFDEVLAVDEALCALEKEDARAARVVTLRYFGGLSDAETAAVLGVSESTVTREWRFARAWLTRTLR